MQPSRTTRVVGSAVCILLTASAAAASPDTRKLEGHPKQVLLWTSHPCTTQWPWPDIHCNATMLSTFLEFITPLRGVVDRVAVNGYYIADPASAASGSGGLVRLPGVTSVVAALHAAGFRVEPLVGNGPPLQYSPPGTLPRQVGSSIDRFRPILRQPALLTALARACAREVEALNLTGLNFDFEFSDCGPDCSSSPHCGRTGSARCNTTTDGAGLGALVTETQRLLAAQGARLSVDVGQCPLTWGNIINQSNADTLITMGTYTGFKSFSIGLEGGLLDFGAERLGVGLCPKCLQVCGHAPHTKQTRATFHSLSSLPRVRTVEWWHRK
jgi:hypothetical protein